MKQISEELLKRIMEYIDDTAYIIDNEFGRAPYGGIDIIRQKDPDDEAVILYDDVKKVVDS